MSFISKRAYMILHKNLYPQVDQIKKKNSRRKRETERAGQAKRQAPVGCRSYAISYSSWKVLSLDFALVNVDENGAEI